MKTLITMAAVAAFAGTGYAQMTTLPPASSTNGVLIQPIGQNAGSTHWDNTTNIASFKIDSTTDGNAGITTVAYNPIGLPFSSSIPTALQTSLNAMNTSGGIIRTIFLSESAKWTDSLGYTYSGNFAGPQSYTAFAQMEANPASGNPVNIQYGNFFDVSLPIGAESKFDLWYQGENAVNGGDYTLFHPSNSSPSILPGNALWAQQALTVNTWNPALGAYVDITTYVVGLEDWRLDGGTDHDYSDAVIAFQLYTLSGTPFAGDAVPEPATYGLIGAFALLGLIAVRKHARKIMPSLGA